MTQRSIFILGLAANAGKWLHNAIVCVVQNEVLKAEEIFVIGSNEVGAWQAELSLLEW